MLTNTRLFSSNAAAYNSPGQRPGFRSLGHRALKGRHNRCIAPSGLGSFWNRKPRALPWAIEFCPVGAEEREKMPRLFTALRERFARRAVLEKQVNKNLEGMGYGR